MLKIPFNMSNTLTPSLSRVLKSSWYYALSLSLLFSNSSGPSLSLVKQAHIVTFTFYFLLKSSCYHFHFHLKLSRPSSLSSTWPPPTSSCWSSSPASPHGWAFALYQPSFWAIPLINHYLTQILKIPQRRFQSDLPCFAFPTWGGNTLSGIDLSGLKHPTFVNFDKISKLVQMVHTSQSQYSLLRVNLIFPILYVLATIVICGLPMIITPVETAIGLAMILSGIHHHHHHTLRKCHF